MKIVKLVHRIINQSAPLPHKVPQTHLDKNADNGNADTQTKKTNPTLKNLINTNDFLFKQQKPSTNKALTGFYYEKYRNLPPNLKLLVRFFTKHSHVLTYILAIVGMIGTFMGLCSTWLIYHLNKKNNDPLVIDRKDAAIKYIEAIDGFREIISLNKIERLDIFTDNIVNSSLSKIEADELAELIVYYSKCTIKISKVSLIEIHNRYKKHIKQEDVSLYKSFIADYKMIEAEGKFYDNLYNDGIFDFNIEVIKIFEEKNITKWKHKITALVSFSQKLEPIRSILHKDLKK